MNKNILSVFFLVAGIGIGYGVATSNMSDNVVTTDDPTMSAMNMTATHTHGMIEVDSSVPLPTVSVEALPDTKDGYNLHIVTSNYLFTPAAAGSAPVQGEGHAHLYVNGRKVARLYGDWFNLSNSELSAGDNLIEVTLNANDHSEWVTGGKHIAASTTVPKVLTQ